jgi:hypothetical protein
LTRTPSGLILNVISGTQIDATWDDAAETADGLRLYYSSDGVNFILGDTVAFGVEAGSITGLTAGVLYTIRLVAYKGSQESTPVTDYAWTPLFILRDEFITAEAAPIASPRTMEPDGGTLTLVQNDGQMSIVDGKLIVPAQTTPNYGDLSAYNSTALAKSTGLAVALLINIDTVDVGQFGGFKYAASGAFSSWNGMVYRDSYGIQLTDSGGSNRKGLTNEPFYGLVQDESIVIIQQDNKHIMFINGMIATIGLAAAQSTSYSGFANYSNAFKMDYYRVAQLPAPFTSEDGIALHRDTTPTSGDTVVGSEDGYIVFTWSAGAGEVLNIRFRRVDDDNCMIVRCDQANSWIRLYRRQGGSETQVATGAFTFNISTSYRIFVRYIMNIIHAGVDDYSIPDLMGYPYSYNLHETGVKVDGFASASLFTVYPAFMTGAARGILNSFTNPYTAGARTRKTVNVPNGSSAAEIAALIATMNGGDILSFAENGTYNMGAGTTAIANLPNGHSMMWTEIRGNGATIIGGSEGLYFAWQSFFAIYGLNMLNQTVHCHNLMSCRNFIHEDCTFASTGQGAGFFDSTHFDKCVDFVVRRCIAGPSNGSASCDGFEFYGDCRNGLFEDCEATGVVHGFEIWTGVSPNWINKNIILRRCNSHGNTGGYSAEGGAQALIHEGIICEDCLASDNGADGDYHADANAILYRRNSPGTIVEATGGQVIDI